MQSRLDLATRLTQHLTQQQLRFVRLLELNAPELDEAVVHELEANPALTAAEPLPTPPSEEPSSPSYFNFGSRTLNAEPDQPAFTPADNSESLSDILFRQIDERKVSPEVATTAKYIVGNLDANGWLTRSLPNILNDLAINHDREVDPATGEEALRLVRSLDPAGIAGENLVETLLLQLRRLPQSEQRDDAIAILTDYFREYHMRHSHRIISGLHISQQRLDAANAFILSLNPKPGASFGGQDATRAAVVIPDFVISDEDGELTIQLTNRIPELAIEESFSEAMASLRAAKEERRRLRRERKSNSVPPGSKTSSEGEFITSRFNEARDFIQLIRQRQQTLMSVMTAIAEYQKAYFETGDIFTLRPMMLKDISAMTGLDLSVISRATANKYAAMPWGEVLPLKSFFSGKVNGPAPGHSKPAKDIVAVREDSRQGSDGANEDQPDDPTSTEKDADALTNRQIQAAIAGLIEDEDPRHPLSDEKIRGRLEALGYDISRRTIAKYRDRANIPVARLRKKL